MTNNLISVIIPVFKAPKTIEQCLNSLCCQTHKKMEIIVVYKSSNDTTLDVIKAFMKQDERIVLIEQKENTGAGGARNLGLEYAHGDWLGFAEADDTLDADFYEKLLSLAQKTGAEIAQGSIVGYNSRKAVQKEVFDSIYDKYSLIRNGASFDKLFKADLIRDHNIRFAEIVRYEDNPFIFKAFYFANKIATTNNAQYHYMPDTKDNNYKRILAQSVVPVATDIMNFVNNVHHTKKEKDIVKQKILQSFADPYVGDAKIYQDLQKVMKNPLILQIRHYQKLFKQLKRKIFHLNRKEQ